MKPCEFRAGGFILTGEGGKLINHPQAPVFLVTSGELALPNVVHHVLTLIVIGYLGLGVLEFVF